MIANKYIQNLTVLQALNNACRSFCLPEYVEIEGDELENDRIIVFDKPDYSDCDEDEREYYESSEEDRYEAWKARNPRFYEDLQDDYDFNCEQVEDENDLVFEYKKRGIDPFEFCFNDNIKSVRVGRRSYATRGLRKNN